MPQNFKDYDPDQLLLLPPSLRDWVPEDSLASFIGETVEVLHERGQLKSFYDSYNAEGVGRAAFHPRMMLKVLLYAYCLGVTSSRKIAQQIETDVAFRFLSGNQRPDFRTIAEFRARHLKAFQQLFVSVLRLCMESGLAKLGRVAIDGRRVKANASRSENKTREELTKQALSLIEEAERVDSEEDDRYADKRGDELPEGLQKSGDRLSRIRECLDRLDEKDAEEQRVYEERLAERERKKKETGKGIGGPPPLPPSKKKKKRRNEMNITDPDSRVMKTQSNGWIQGYNGQAAVDCEYQIVVGQGVTNEQNDRNQLKPMIEAVKQQSGRKPKQLLADAGYVSFRNLELEDEETEFFIAQTTNKKQARQIAPRGRRPQGLTPIEKMERKLLTKRARKIYKDRLPSAEGLFGQMWTRGLQQFVLRGAKKVEAEWAIWCATHNLLKLFRYGPA